MICFLVASVCLSGACRERDIEVYDANRVSLNIAKGEFRPGTYPESYEFNAYFLGVGAGDYTLDIPVRLTGAVDYDRDREYRVRVNEELSQYAVNGVEYTLDERFCGAIHSVDWACIRVLSQVIHSVNEKKNDINKYYFLREL